MRVKLTGKILVPVDGSPHAKKALEHAIAQAKLTGSSITTMYVVHTRVYGAAQEAGFATIAPLVHDLEEYGRRILGEAQATGQAAGIETNTFLVHGLPADEIIRKAEIDKYDMIVIGNRGRTIAKSILLGSVSNRVSHRAKCPVLIVK
jgi:nucleotide-binding universal stress UspA family protein